MSRLGSLYKKDMILGFKDVWILLELGASVLISAMLIFVVPKEINRDSSLFIQDETGIFQKMTEQLGDKEESSQVFVDSRKEVVNGVEKNKTALGMIISSVDSGKYHVEMLTQPYSSDAIVDFFEVQMKDVFTMLAGPKSGYSPEILQKVEVKVMDDRVYEEVPFNKRLIPLVLMFIIGFMGLFTMISLIGQERTDQTIRAYKVTPASLGMLLTSKNLLLLTVGLITFSIMYLSNVGFSGYPQALLIIVPTILIGSALGVILGSFFDNPMAAIGWVLLFMILFGLPGVSLFAPVFSPEWMKFLPTYYTIFGLDAAIFPDGYSNTLWSSVGILSATAAVLIPLSGWIFTRKMRKEF